MLKTFLAVLADSPELPKSDDYISKIIPNWVSFTAQIGALIVLIVVMIVFAYKPVKKIITKRQDYIESNIHDSEVNNALAHENVLKSEEMIIESKKEAALIITNAQTQALNERKRLEYETNELIKRMKIEADNDINASREEALESIHNEMVDIALSASKEVLKREVKSDDNVRLIEDFINDVEDNN